MNPRQYFPLGRAYSMAFCNRVIETDWLLGNIDGVKHSLLIAARRFGKSSLAEKALIKSQLPYVEVNFHLCTTEEEVAELIVDASTKLIGKAVGPIEKVMQQIKNILSNVTPEFPFLDDIVKLSLKPRDDKNISIVIYESLMLVEKLLKYKKKKAILFLDEFQEIARISNNAKIEGAILTAVQEDRKSVV